MRTILNDGEIVIKEGGANSKWGKEYVGGHLYLTNERLIFESHALNFQTGTLYVSLSDITNVTKSKTFSILPNSIIVETNKGGVQFVLYGREKWIDSIMEMVKKLKV